VDDKQKELARIEQELLEELLREEKEPEQAPEVNEEELLEELLREKEELEQAPEVNEEELLEELLREEEEPEQAPEKEEPPVPAFEDPERIADPGEPMVYCNFSNDYGKDLEEALKEEPPKAAASKPSFRFVSVGKTKKDEKIIIGLMLAVSVLCVGILGVLIYWLETFLKLL